MVYAVLFNQITSDAELPWDGIWYICEVFEARKFLDGPPLFFYKILMRTRIFLSVLQADKYPVT